MFDLEKQIHSWRDHLRANGNLSDTDIHELENHLRDEIKGLTAAGLAPDESFLIGVKRIADANLKANVISHKFAKVNIEDLWRNFFVERIDSQARQRMRRDIALVVIFALLAGTLFKIAEHFAFRFLDQDAQRFLIKNLSLFVLPFIASFFLIKRKAELKTWATILGIFILAAFIINVYPSFAPHHTEYLTGFHLPLFLWLVVGVAYIGREWQSSQGRMNFIRFTGEAVIYGVLVMAGIFVLGLFTLVIFKAIQVDAERFLEEYLLIYGGCAAAMITIYLVEARKGVVENFAPILAKIFSPLFLIIMAAFLIVMIITGNSPFMERNFLIAFDFMLALVLGLVLYVISARNIQHPANLFDYSNLALIIMALVIDGVALSAILFRLSAFGISPNKMAALGENLALLGNLAGLAWLYIRYKKKYDFTRLIKWQTDYLYVYFVWTAIVAFIFPIIFRFN